MVIVLPRYLYTQPSGSAENRLKNTKHCIPRKSGFESGFDGIVWGGWAGAGVQCIRESGIGVWKSANAAELVYIYRLP